MLRGADLLAWRTQALANLAQIDSNVTDVHSRADLTRELDWLIRETTGVDRLKLRLGLIRPGESLPSSRSLAELESLWHERVYQAVPLQYLLGYTAWRSFSLKVSPAVLIPRPETEQLIDIVSETTRPVQRQGQWVDVGTGSGAIALGLADLLPQAQIHAVDISDDALAIAKINAAQYGLDPRIQFWQGSLFDPLPKPLQLHGICSNPPYIPTTLVSTLQPEVHQHEPHIALDGGDDGLAIIRSLVSQSYAYLVPEGMLILECMAGQGEAIASLMRTHQYHAVQIHYDLAGIDRFVQGFK
ncbi:MAG: peptide chain release factor N(5)-glutamine methyltransferase [Cyanobacteria bacterium P01_F01_bin.42]